LLPTANDDPTVWFICLSVTLVHPAIAVGLDEMLYLAGTLVTTSIVLDRGPCPPREGEIWGRKCIFVLEVFDRKCLTLGMLLFKLPLLIPKSCIVNRQFGFGDSKYVVISDPYPLPTGHMTQRNTHAACKWAV